MQWVAAYVGAAVVFLSIEYVWLGKLAKSFYWSRLGELLRERPMASAAVIFYMTYIAGIVLFAVAPAVNTGTWQTSLLLGSLFGFFAYMTYDMTNLATLKNWPVSVAVVDVAWGTALTGVTALAGYFAAQSFQAPVG